MISQNHNLEVLHKEIDLIQNCINRISSQSFLLKGWFLTIFVASFSYYLEKKQSIEIGYLILGMNFLFWTLDTHFIRIERMYRKGYEVVIGQPNQINRIVYDLDPKKYKHLVDGHFTTMTSWSLLYFYGMPFLLSLYFNIKGLFR